MTDSPAKLYLVLTILPQVPATWAEHGAVGFVPDGAAEHHAAAAMLCMANDPAMAVNLATESAEQDYDTKPSAALVRDLSPYADQLIEQELDGETTPGTLLDTGLRLLVGDDEPSRHEAMQYAFDVLMAEDESDNNGRR